MWETAPNRLCKIKTEKQTSDSALQVTGDSNDQFQWKRDDESLTGVCFRAGERAEESEYRKLFGRVLLQCREKNSIAAVETIKQRFFFFLSLRLRTIFRI